MTATLFAPAGTNRVGWPGKSHRGRGNLVFVDGHVESARQTNWLSPATRHRWNNDGQPHPETWARD